MMKKILSYLLPILFVLVLILPSFNSVFNIWTFERVDENREFQDSVRFDINELDTIALDYNNYVNDNFSFRTPMLDLYKRFKFYVFKISPYPNKTIVGKDGWYFVGGQEMVIYKGEKNYSEDQLDKFETEWLYRKDYLDSLDIKCYWIIAPIKQYVYSDKIPFNIISGEQRRVDQIKNHFDSVLPDLIIDPYEKLVQEKENTKLYYRLDNHWNFRAGHIIANVLMERINKDFPDYKFGDIPDVEWKETIIQKGFHFNILGLNELSETEYTPLYTPQADVIHKYDFQAPEEFPYKWDYLYQYTNPEVDNGIKILVIRDSFFGLVMPFLSGCFHETVYIFDSWQYDLDKDIIEEVQPDIIIFESLETYIDNIIY